MPPKGYKNPLGGFIVALSENSNILALRISLSLQEVNFS